MPSFFTVLGRVVSGKPAFDPNDGQPPQDGGSQIDQGVGDLPASANDQERNVDKSDSRTFPVVLIRRCDVRINGNRMELYCHIVNSSSMLIKLDRIRLLGHEERLEYDLSPNQERQILVYSGPQPNTQYENQAILKYKTEDGDYFQATNDIKFTYRSDTKTYIVDEIHLRPPIRDIFG